MTKTKLLIAALIVGSSAVAQASVLCISAKLTGTIKLRDACKEKQIQIGTFDGTTLQFSGINVQVVSGSGATDGAVNGLGNLIVGYNKNVSGNVRTGSHNLIVGDDHEYTSYGGVVAGSNNKIIGASAVVSGGSGSTAAGNFSSVSGGFGNTANGAGSSISGGGGNTAYDSSSILGGFSNTSNFDYSTISGGRANSTGALFSSVSGGLDNDASGEYSSVSGGHGNIASGHRSSISGGGGVSSSSSLGWKAGSFGSAIGPNQFFSQ
jgi:hypothetical protein